MGKIVKNQRTGQIKRYDPIYASSGGEEGTKTSKTLPDHLGSELEGAFSSLSKLIVQLQSSELNTRILAFSALLSLSSEQNMIQPLMKKGILGLSIRALEDQSLDVVCSSLAVVINMISSSKECVEEVMQKNVVCYLAGKMIPELLRKKSWEVLEIIVELLLLLSEKDENSVMKMIDSSILDPIFDIISDGESTEHLKVLSLELLWSILEIYPESSAALSKESLGSLILILEEQDEDMKVLSCGIIAIWMKNCDNIENSDVFFNVLNTCSKNVLNTASLSAPGDESDANNRAQGYKRAKVSIEILLLLSEKFEDGNNQMDMDESIDMGQEVQGISYEILNHGTTSRKINSKNLPAHTTQVLLSQNFILNLLDKLMQITHKIENPPRELNLEMIIFEWRCYSFLCMCAERIADLAQSGDSVVEFMCSIAQKLLSLSEVKMNNLELDAEGILTAESSVGALASYARILVEICADKISFDSVFKTNPEKFVALIESWYSKSLSIHHGMEPVLMDLLEQIRVHLLITLNVICNDMSLKEEGVQRLGDLLLKVIEGTVSNSNPSSVTFGDKESSPSVLSEAINCFIDLFGPDAYNHVFGNSNFMERMKKIGPLLKPWSKKIPHTKSPLIITNIAQYSTDIDKEIGERIFEDQTMIKERLDEMILNFKRFIQYKQGI